MASSGVRLSGFKQPVYKGEFERGRINRSGRRIRRAGCVQLQVGDPRVNHTLSEVKDMYEDKTLQCKECGADFIFTAGEQEFYNERGFVNEPQRCKGCRDARKNAGRAEREMFTAECAECGVEAKVPFRPREDRPVFCSECFAKQKEAGQ